MSVRLLVLAVTATSLLTVIGRPALALNPRRVVSQYIGTAWTQEQGLPQDTIHAIAQTQDGYLWLGTDEGLAQFDGYDFVVFNKENGSLPNNSIDALCASRDGSLWIGTAGGLTRYRDHKFTTYTRKDGLEDILISSIAEDRSGAVWMIAGISLVRFQDGKFTSHWAANQLSIATVRSVYVNRRGDLYVAGFEGVARLEGNRFTPIVRIPDMGVAMTEDRGGNLWVAGAHGIGLVMRTPRGSIRQYTTEDGLPDNFVRSLCEDRDGNIWAGTNAGLARLENGKFISYPSAGSRERDWVRCIYEDTDGNLWVGMNSGLNRFRDDVFTMYGAPEGLPSDQPTTVYQDRRGRIWIGTHDRGLVQFASGEPVVYTTSNGLPSNEIFSIREALNGDLLIGTRQGPSRMHDGRFINRVIDDPLNRHHAFDFLEDHQGRLWVAAPSGLLQLQGRVTSKAIPGGRILNHSFVVLSETREGSLWAGSYGQGLWQLKDGHQRHYTTADGLSSDQVRSLLEDADGILWVGTFGGGLNGFRNGHFFHVTSAQGLLSDNISHIEDDGHGSLWLSTTSGICRVQKREIDNLAAGKTKYITPTNFTVADGLRSAQCAPGYPTSGGGTQTRDGRLWFPTGRGLAVLDAKEKPPTVTAAIVHLLEVTVDGRPTPLAAANVFPPGNGRVEFRYTGIHLGAPELVRYSYRLEGVDREWINSVTRRTSYGSLPHGSYRFVVRAAIPGGPWSETAFAFVLQPHFYETGWFLCICIALAGAGIWGIYLWHLRQIHQRFALVLEERARLAREIHDNLAQGFVGVSSQLDAVVLTLDTRLDVARRHLHLARKMVRHSLTEARRSMMDLRASALEGRDLPSALSEVARRVTAGTPIQVHVRVAGEWRHLSEEMEQQLLRIAQEAVTNSVKHSKAKEVRICLAWEDRELSLRVADDGQGFEEAANSWKEGGHFGLLGMRERAERLGGVLQFHSETGQGTEVEVKVPLA